MRPKVERVDIYRQRGPSLAKVDGKDVAAAGVGTWRRQEDAVIQSVGTEACVLGNAKGVVVEDERWEDEKL